MNVYAVGKIVGCFGLKGELKIQPMTHSLERLTTLSRVFLGRSEETCLPYTVESVHFPQGLPHIKLFDVQERTSAEAFIGSYIYVSEADLARPPEGTYFRHDIIGCEVRTSDNRVLGTVEEVFSYPAQDVWIVRNGTAEVMIPAVKEFIKTIDVAQKKIIVNIIEGLIEE